MCWQECPLCLKIGIGKIGAPYCRSCHDQVVEHTWTHVVECQVMRDAATRYGVKPNLLPPVLNPLNVEAMKLTKSLMNPEFLASGHKSPKLQGAYDAARLRSSSARRKGRVPRESDPPLRAGAGNLYAPGLPRGLGGHALQTGQRLPGAYFFHQDHLDSIRLITNNEGKVISRYDYLPFGGAMGPRSSAKFSNDIQFGGYRADEETGLTYMGARYYDAELARFASAASTSSRTRRS